MTKNGDSQNASDNPIDMLVSRYYSSVHEPPSKVDVKFCDDDFENERNFNSFGDESMPKKLQNESDIVAYLNNYCQLRPLPQSELVKREILNKNGTKHLNSTEVSEKFKDPKMWLAISATGRVLKAEIDQNKSTLLSRLIREPQRSIQNEQTVMKIEMEPQHSVQNGQTEIKIEAEQTEIEIKVDKILKSYRNDAVSLLQIFCAKQNLPLPQYSDYGHLDGYSYSVKIGDMKYCKNKVAASKKVAKRLAAKDVLVSILMEHSAFSQINDVEELKNALLAVKKKKITQLSSPNISCVEQFNIAQRDDLFFKVGRLVTEKFREIISDDANLLQNVIPKVFSGFVINDSVTNTFQVICVTTGNQCITGDKIKLNGTVLNDCHAEILAKRCLSRYIYLHLLNRNFNTDDALFEQTEKGILKLKERYSFHLYISTSPCGDGRTFAISDLAEQKESSSQNLHLPLLSDPLKHGLLRCKIECGEGSIPIRETFDVQTLDGINVGERLYTMSCSDKILKWNVLGVQGTLLANFLEPIYLSSLTIGSLYHSGHLSRAICCRIADLTDLPEPYHLNHPVIGQGGVDARRDIVKKKSVTFNWIALEGDKFERIDGSTGLTTSGFQSRLCKSQMYSLYKLLKRQRTPEKFDALVLEYYLEAKMKNEIYQKSKKIFLKCLKDKNCGLWVNKPVEEKLFC